MNLIERLRSRCEDLAERYHRSPDDVEPDLWKAANEIERLQGILEYARRDGKSNLKYITEIQRFRNALWEITKGKGRYSMDKLEHASNTIEDMKEIATNVLHQKPE